ncbi:MAG TPA: hypothetical protein VK666_07880 [Chryseolinea sp.]|nr:hypothetical protein [Chryseolinea sp.]
MKRLLPLTVMVMLTATVNAQTLIGRIQEGPFIQAELYSNHTATDSSYFLRFDDFTTLQEVTYDTLYIPGGNTQINDLYKVLKNGMRHEVGYTDERNYGGVPVSFVSGKLVGLKYVRLGKGNAWINIHKNGLDYLFGLKKHI